MSKLTKLAVENLFEAVREQRMMILELENNLITKVDRQEFQENLSDKVTIEEVANATSILIDKKMKKKSKNFSKKKIGKIETKVTFLEQKLERIELGKDKRQEFEFEKIIREIDQILDSRVSRAIKDATHDFDRLINEKSENFEKIVKICNEKDKVLKKDFNFFSSKLNLLETAFSKLETNSEKSEPKQNFDLKNIFLEIEEFKFECELNMKRMQESLTEVIDGVLEEKIKEENYELNQEISSLKKNNFDFQENLKNFKKSINSKIQSISGNMDKRVRDVLVSNVKIKEDLNNESLEFFSEIKDSLKNQFSDTIKSTQKEIEILKGKFEILMNDQEELCKESSNLLTNICIKEEQSDLKFEQIFESFQKFESKQNSLEDFIDRDKAKEFISRQDLNDYYSNLKNEISEKVDLSEVQLALNEMQGKLQLSLVKNSQSFFEAMNGVKKRSSENFKKIFKYLKEDKGRREKGGKRGLKENLGDADEIVTNENMALIIEEVEMVKAKIEENLTREGKDQ